MTQDVFLKAFQHLSSFKAESSFSTWIYSIAYNTAISATRKKKFDTFAMDDTLLANISDQQVDETLNDESEEMIIRLNRAIEKLNSDERALIYFCMYIILIGAYLNRYFRPVNRVLVNHASSKSELARENRRRIREIKKIQRRKKHYTEIDRDPKEG